MIYDSGRGVPAVSEPSHDELRAPDGGTPFVFGGGWRPVLSRGWGITWMLILVCFLLPLRALYLSAGSTMEEAFMLVFPERLLAGDLPNVDFLHLYGPASLHVLAGWYTVFGESLASERTVAVLQFLGAVGAIAVLVRPWGWRAMVPAATTMTFLLITPTGLAALAWPGALALALASIVFAIRSTHLTGRAKSITALAAGVLGGLALSYRPDLVLAVGLAWAVLLWRGVPYRAALGGGLIGAIPMWIHLALVGVRPAWRGMVSEPVGELRPGRRLPVPPSWSKLDGALQALTENPIESPWWGLPSMSASHQIFIWFFVLLVITVGCVGVGVWWWRRDGATPRNVLYLTVALFGLGLIGQALQRPDSAHLAWGASVPFALLAVVVADSFDRAMVERRREALTPGIRTVDVALPSVALAVVLLVVCPFFTLRPYLFSARVSLGNKASPGLPVDHDGRRFYMSNVAVQTASQQAVDQLGALAAPGDRLLVGPADLSRTVYSDVMFYYLLPDLVPATPFIEMDPGIADAPDSGLADDVESADWLILTNFWTGWYEPNASIEFGSTAPNEVVASDFCLIGNYDNGLVMVFERCVSGDGVDPSTIGIGPERRASMFEERARRSGG